MASKDSKKPKYSTKSKKTEKVEEIKQTSQSEDDEEPSWYHYVIVLAVLLGGLFLILFISDKFSSSDDLVPVENSSEYVSKYVYEHEIGKTKYNIQISLPTEDILALDYRNEISHFELLNTISYTFAFDTYNGTDNGFVTVSASKLRRFLSAVYFADFKNTSFQTLPNYSCANSTTSNRVIELRVNQNESGIFEDENGCIILSSTEAKTLPWVADYFMVTVLKDEERFNS